MGSGINDPVRYFGRQVHKERLAAGWTLGEFGQRIGYDPGHVSRIESGKRPATDVFAKACDQVFPHRADWFSEFYEESRSWIATPPWFRNYVSHEQRARTLRNWFPSLMDGLLQTEEYARKILAVSPGTTEDQVDARLAARLKRQSILTREDAPTAWLLVDEAALRRCVGSPETMAAQMSHVLAVAQLPTITIQVVPAIEHVGLLGGFSLTEHAAYVETAVAGQVFEDAEIIAGLLTRFDTLRNEALRASESLTFIERMRAEWKATGARAVTRATTEEPASR
jgi:transcriptional regulator with XRE-family HTH domain